MCSAVLAGVGAGGAWPTGSCGPQRLPGQLQPVRSLTAASTRVESVRCLPQARPARPPPRSEHLGELSGCEQFAQFVTYPRCQRVRAPRRHCRAICAFSSGSCGHGLDCTDMPHAHPRPGTRRRPLLSWATSRQPCWARSKPAGSVTGFAPASPCAPPWARSCVGSALPVTDRGNYSDGTSSSGPPGGEIQPSACRW